MQKDDHHSSLYAVVQKIKPTQLHEILTSLKNSSTGSLGSKFSKIWSSDCIR